ncbi:hypothetical protein Ari01nite_92150 [Paractinoplanes rishiriensis]|uniref:Transglycosylase n=1 Tax=Paractinoplanes rishiriensis TaxID=1050105 RepID=A0A919N1L2_9ACTN|nr:hypothetical protein Ari01nite_92150 [Actinoplanes rishiriensis]
MQKAQVRRTHDDLTHVDSFELNNPRRSRQGANGLTVRQIRRWSATPAARYGQGSRLLTGKPGTGNSATSIKERNVEITGIFTAIIIGLIIGALGRLVVPGKQNIPIWLTLVIGVVAALIGTFLAAAVGVDETPGIDWIELALQIGLAAAGVAAVAGARGRRH